MLFGQNELATNLESKKELKSRMYRSALASLTREDMENMIAFRFQVAGGEKHPFTTGALDELLRLSVGLPRNICKICDMALLRAYANEKSEVDTDIIRQTAEQLAIREEETAPNSKKMRHSGTVRRKRKR